MRAFRCGLHILFCSIVPVMLTGCGDGSTTPSSPFGANCTQTTVLQGSGSLPAYTADVESITTTQKGRLDVTFDWTSPSSTMLVAVAQDPCSFDQFQAGTCTVLLNSSSPPKPLKGSVQDAAAGNYVVFLGNANSVAESVSVQVVSNSGNCPAASPMTAPAAQTMPIGIRSAGSGLIREN
jgi:hypothetical protein